MDQLRKEIAERSPCEAASCSSWDRGVHWLRAQGHHEIAEWLELTVSGVRRERDRLQMHSVSQQVLTWSNRTMLLLWSGRLGWSYWFGPLVLAYVGPASPSLTELREQLGPHGMLLTDDRAWLDGERRWLEERERELPLLVVRTLPGSQAPICRHLLREVGELPPHDGRLEWGDTGWPRSTDDELPESHRIVSLDSFERLRVLESRADEAVAVVGPSELLSQWPKQGQWLGARGAIRHATSLGLFAEGGVAESSQYPDTASFRLLALDENPGARRRAGLHHGLLASFAPPPVFERRYEQLGSRCPELFRQLRSELAARPLVEAHTCPSWPVFADWLLEQGEVLLAECLQDELECRHEGEHLPARNRLAYMSGPLRPGEAKHFRKLMAVGRDLQRDRARSSWFGPFLLDYHDPWLSAGFGADEVQAILGRYASFLARVRVHTGGKKTSE